MLKQIIGIGGAKFAGKNTAATIFRNKYGFKELSFAFPLKIAVAQAFDLTYRELDDPELKEKPFKKDIKMNIHALNSLKKVLSRYHTFTEKDFIKMLLEIGPQRFFSTPRQLLQYVGTDLIRNCVDNMFWCKAFIHDCKPYEAIVVPDVRFANERATIKEMGGKLVLIKRGTETITDSHMSENSLGNDDDYDIVFNNTSDISNLHDDLDKWYTRYRAMEKIGL